MPRLAVALLALAVAAASAAAQPLPAVPTPAENPLTEEKRILGKILFWDEQLSSDNTVACGTCHQPRFGGSDPRSAVNPGADGALGTRDDVRGSPGIARLDPQGNRLDHPVFGHGSQATTRAAPSAFGGLWAEAQFWDGRAGPAFADPLTGETLIAEGGALEAQALEPLLNPVEMAREGRDWAEVAGKLEAADPLALADELPADIAARLGRDAAERPSYPALFAAAFGDAAITPQRIAFAIASYERTLVADQTLWDVAEAGGTPLSTAAQVGFVMFKQQRCDACHTPPLFTNNEYFNIGLRPATDDAGRQSVSGAAEHAGDMKVPSLRNVGLRPRLMHTGEMPTLREVLLLYASSRFARDSLPGGGEYRLSQGFIRDGYLEAFLREALTDPRVAAEAFPFDRPRLRSERAPDDARPPRRPSRLRAEPFGEGGVRLTWRAARDDTGVADYVIRRDGAVIGYATRTELVDPDGAEGARYAVTARDAPGNESDAVEVEMRPRG
jgi:cytochrome c peroxidase